MTSSWFKPAAAALFAVFLFACAAKRGKPPSRDINQPVVENFAAAAPAFDGRIQVIAFNIERGFYWQDVVRYAREKIAEIPATVLLLSECDRNHSRTREVFVAREIAKALSMNMAFATEYIEYNDQTPENQGDHGNAVLAPFPLSEVTVIRHRTVYSWTKWGWLYGQPRYGDRVTLAATLTLPDGRRLRVYSTHLESNAEAVGKWLQIKQLLPDLEAHDLPAVIGGDFNELPCGLMFSLLPEHGVKNAFAGDLSPTGSCRPGPGRARCFLKIDWIVYKGLELEGRFVDYPLNSSGGVISDHAPVRAVFLVPSRGDRPLSPAEP